MRPMRLFHCVEPVPVACCSWPSRSTRCSPADPVARARWPEPAPTGRLQPVSTVRVDGASGAVADTQDQPGHGGRDQRRRRACAADQHDRQVGEVLHEADRALGDLDAEQHERRAGAPSGACAGSQQRSTQADA